MSRDAKKIFADIDTFNPDRFVAHLTSDAVFRFANAEPVTGREAIRQAVGAFFATIGGLHHSVHDVWQFDDTTIVKTDVRYTRKDGTTVTLPNADILTYDGDLVRDWQIYIDLAPVYNQ